MRNGEFFYVVCGLRRRSDTRRCRSVVQERCRSFHDESVRDKDSSAERGSRRCCRTLSHVSTTRSAILQTSGDLKNRLQSRDKP